MRVEYVEETSVRKALAFELEPSILEQEIDKRAHDYARKARLPGFRPGKVPAQVIRQRYRGLVLEEAIEAVVNRVVPAELEGRGLRPLASPQIADLKHDPGAPLSFRVVFETLPILELPDYHGLEARTREAQVTDEQLDQQLEALRERNARFDPVEGRGVQAGDFTVVDLAFSPLDGGHGGREENALIEIGGEDTAPEVREALIGALPGEAREADVTRSGTADEPPRRVHYALTLKAIKSKVLPTLDDEFAKDLGDFDNLDALRQDVRGRLLRDEQRRLDHEVKQALVEELSRRANFDVPEALIARHMNARTEQAARALAQQGLDPGKTGIDWKAYRESQRAAAASAAKAEILLDEIARVEGVEVLPSEVDAEITRYAQVARKPKAALRQQMEKDGDVEGLRAHIRVEKTLDLLKANARLIFE